MSEKLSIDKASTSADDETSWTDDCCAICLQTAELPIIFPCSHKFCFLCAKGAGFRDKRCALCRSEIPEDFLTKQSIQISPSAEQEPGQDADRFVWFYEGYNGWWRYDERNGAEVEKAFGDGRPSVDLLLAGNVYVVNFRKMIQYRKSEPAKRRRVKRDLVKTPVKGVAGLKIVPPTVASVENSIQSTNGPSTSDAGEKSLSDLVNRLTIGEDEENS